MPTSRYDRPESTLIAILFLILTVAACSGSGGGGDSGGSDAGSASAQAATSTEGAVAILLTDAPADPSLFSEINTVIDRIELIGGDDRTRGSLYEGDAQTIDLLDLRTHSLPLGMHLSIPSERYCKIRLYVDAIELVLTNGDRVPAEIPGNGRIDLVLGDCFTVREGETALVQLDVDAAHSIHIVEAPPGSRRFLFRPVVHADVITGTFEEKVVRLEGVLAKVDGSENQILVCDVVPVAQTVDTPLYRGCVEIRIPGEAAVFDNLTEGGRPQALDTLFDDDLLGTSVTVVGKIDPFLPARPAIRVPPGHRPRSGRCKVWYFDTPPGHQPSETRCDLDHSDIPADAVLIDSAGRPVVDHRGLLAMDAFVVQLGPVLRLTGIVDTPIEDDLLTVFVDEGQTVSSEQALSVVVQAAPIGGNGTRLLSTTGEPLNPEDVLVDDAVLLDGVLVLDESDFLRAALILVDLMRAETTLSGGQVTRLLPGGFELDAEENGCGENDATLDVRIAAAARVLTVAITDAGSTTTLGGQVVAGDTVTATGICDSIGLEADVVLILDDQRSADSPQMTNDVPEA